MTDKIPPIQNIEHVATLPLKERRGEILPLVREVIKLSEQQLGTSLKDLSKEVEEHLLTYDWPGGEKELETAVKRACILSDEPLLHIEDFDLKQRQARSIGKFVESKLKSFMRNIKNLEKFNLYDMVIPEVERSLILMVMKETKGNQIKASKLLGINRNTLRSKIKTLGIKVKP
ncbi:MAG: helix-turn-helix domain-containing protein [Nitrospirota bacterium]